MSELQLSKQERRRLKMEQRRQEKQIELQQIENKSKMKKLVTIAVVVLFFGSVFSFFAFFSPSTPTANVVLNTAGLNFPLGKIHWHATPIINICGERKQIPTPASDAHLGTQLLHTHKDALIHIEGTVTRPSEILLGYFFDNIGVKFSETELMEKKNDDLCQNGEQGKVKILVNGRQNNEFRNYVIRDGDFIELSFE